MHPVQRVCCCAAVALGIGLFGSEVHGQFHSPGPAPQPTPAPSEPSASSQPHPLCYCVGEGGSASIARIRKALGSPLHAAGLDFSALPLQEVAATLQQEYDIPIQIDTPALEDEGLTPDEPVSINIHGVSLRSALRLMLRRVNLTYMIQNEVLIITTPDEAETHLVTCVYDVRDLIGRAGDFGSLDQLVSVIHNTVATNTWAENGGGEAAIRTMPRGLLIISQTEGVQDEIRNLLRALRAADPPSSDAARTGPVAPVADEVVTRYYMLPRADRQEREQWGDQLVALIMRSMPDERWREPLPDDQRAALVALPDRLVVRHRRPVVERVEQVLREVGLVSRPGGPGGGQLHPGGSGGGMFSPPPGQNPFAD